MAADELDRGQARIMRAVRHASDDWAEAMRAHKLAPPDAGFAARLRTLAEAAETEQVAWEHAHAAGLLWRPVPGAESAQPPYELRPGTGRRGPEDLWARFDRSVARLNVAITGSDAAQVADAFGDIAEAGRALADAVAVEDASAGGADGIRGADGAAPGDAPDAPDAPDAFRARGAA
jgi:hypothetical protein